MYLRGIDFFNHGYYWEAHEAWENLWHAAGRRGPVAEFLKGLIALAAAGVKAREGRAAGVKQHARRAGSIFDAIKVQTLADEKTDFMGMNLSALIDAAIKLAAAPEKALNMADRAVVIVFEFQLSLWVGPPGVHQASE
jgi:predicted metal-dependent hydrolase